MNKLEGKVAVITGGNSGIGLATEKEFVADGAYVFVTGRRQIELNVAVRYIGNNVTDIQDDVSNLGDLDRLFFSFEQSGFYSLPIPNDGMVCVSSVESQDYFINLGHSTNCHSNLLSDYEYELAKDLILEKKK